MTLEDKIKKALKECVRDGVIIGSGDDSDWCVGFCIDGKDQFFTDYLVPKLFDEEKVDFITDYIPIFELWGANEICGYMVSKGVNPLRPIAHIAADRILELYSDFISDEIRELEKNQ